jgi:PPOX class probable F420-dependent enzyme
MTDDTQTPAYPPGAGPAPRVLTESEALDAVAAHQAAVLATVSSQGFPSMSNVFYAWDPVTRIARISTLSGRAKVGQLRRNPKCALHVSLGDFWTFVVAKGEADVSEPSTSPGDAVGLELLSIQPVYDTPSQRAAYLAQMVRDGRCVIRLKVTRVYGTSLGL